MLDLMTNYFVCEMTLCVISINLRRMKNVNRWNFHPPWNNIQAETILMALYNTSYFFSIFPKSKQLRVKDNPFHRL